VWDAALQGKPIPNGLSGAKWPADKPIPAGFAVDLRELDTPLQVLQAPSRDSGVRVFWTEFSPDGKLLITTHANGHVKVWNTSSWNLEADLALTHREVRAATFSPDSSSLFIGDVEGTLHQWNFASKSEVKTTRTIGPIAGVVFSPDGKTLVTAHQSPSGWRVMIWNTDTWVAATRDGFAAAAFSKDGKILALGGKSIELIDPSSQKELLKIEFFHPKKQPVGDTKGRRFVVVALAFSPDGTTLATGFDNGDVVLNRMGLDLPKFGGQ
jgi:WD40 repeat protein